MGGLNGSAFGTHSGNEVQDRTRKAARTRERVSEQRGPLGDLSKTIFRTLAKLWSGAEDEKEKHAMKEEQARV